MFLLLANNFWAKLKMTRKEKGWKKNLSQIQRILRQFEDQSPALNLPQDVNQNVRYVKTYLGH